MKSFRDMKFRILIATDVAARGIDVPHIEHVINYDLPQMAEDFIHRIGRTARAGSKGVALSFVTKGDFAKWKEIQKILNPGKNIKNQSTSKTRNSKKSFSKKREGNKRPTFKKKSDYKKSFSKNDEGSDKKTFSKKRFSKDSDQGKYKRSSDSESRTRKPFSRNNEGFDKKTFSKKRFSKDSDQGKYKRSSDSESRTRKPFSRNNEGFDKKTFSKKRFSKDSDQGKYKRSSDSESRTRKPFSRNNEGFDKKTYSRKDSQKIVISTKDHQIVNLELENHFQGFDKKIQKINQIVSESRTRVSFSRNDGGSDKKNFSKKRFTKSKSSLISNTDKEFSPRSKSGFNKKKSSNKKSNNFSTAGAPRKRRNK